MLYKTGVFFHEQKDLVEPRWCSLMEPVSGRRAPKKLRWRSTSEFGAGTFSKPHMRVLAWWIDMAKLDWPIIGLGGGLEVGLPTYGLHPGSSHQRGSISSPVDELLSSHPPTRFNKVTPTDEVQ